jgi:hypothetical protein
MSCLNLTLAWIVAATAGAALASPPPTSDLESRALLKRYCYECHGDGASSGDIAMDAYRNLADVRKAKDTWAKIISYARNQTMPPPDAERQPSQDERDALVASLTRQVYDIDPNHPDPGPPVLRRLNQTEYRNTIRDLTGVTFDTTLDFPQDDTGYGFDNIGDVLTLPPMLLEKYLHAADKILDQALPVDDPSKKPTEPIRRLFARHGAATTRPVSSERSVARSILADFARHAWRRPPRPDEVDRLMALYSFARDNDESFRGGVQHAMKGILVSPNFLFRGGIDTAATGSSGMQRVGEFELASRLSYFLWSTTPDDELLDLAGRGALRTSLAQQVKRMLASPKSKAFVENFAGQWLQFRNLDAAHPDEKMFEVYDDRIRDDMRRETETFFTSLLKDDRNPIELLTADYTFLDERLAKYYGIPGVKGKEFRRVSLAGTPRRGILTQGSILTLTSNPTRTSPVKRGKWVLESLLGAAPPAPPPNLPSLDGGDAKHRPTGTLRQRMEQHRADPDCAACHAPMDPIGFGLENFDAVGRWRDKDGKDPIDPASSFPDGTKFRGAVELANLLAKTRRNDFYRALTEAAMTYAIGRGVEPFDQPAVDRIVAALRREDAGFSALILGVINSTPFQMRRGEPPSAARQAAFHGKIDTARSPAPATATPTEARRDEQ